MSDEPGDRIRTLVAELRAVIKTTNQPLIAEEYAHALLDGQLYLPHVTEEQLKAAYTRKTPADDPAAWDAFDPAKYTTVTVEEFMAMLRSDERAEGGGK